MVSLDQNGRLQPMFVLWILKKSSLYSVKNNQILSNNVHNCSLYNLLKQINILSPINKLFPKKYKT